MWLTVTAEITATVGWFFFDWAGRNDWTPSSLLAAHR